MILGDLNQNSHAFAQRYASEFDEKSKVLGQFPEIGRPVQKLLQTLGARSFTHTSFSPL